MWVWLILRSSRLLHTRPWQAFKVANLILRLEVGHTYAMCWHWTSQHSTVPDHAAAAINAALIWRAVCTAASGATQCMSLPVSKTWQPKKWTCLCLATPSSATFCVCTYLQRRLGVWAYSLIVVTSVIFWFGGLSDCSRAAFQYHGMPTTEVGTDSQHSEAVAYAGLLQGLHACSKRHKHHVMHCAATKPCDSLDAAVRCCMMVITSQRCLLANHIYCVSQH